MLRGWLLRSCAASSSRSNLAPATRLISHASASRYHGGFVLGQVQQGRARRPEVACLAGVEVGRLYAKSASHKAAGSFEDLSLNPQLLEALKSAQFSKPTEIQSMAMPAILQGGDYLLASQTGSGKTLAYLLPLVHLMKAQEDEPGRERRPKRPKILVLGPTKELTEQITSVAKSLCHFAKFKAVCCNANSSEAQQAKQLSGPVDMVVATPTRLIQLMGGGKLALGDVQWFVIDEADTMFDQGFGEEVKQVLSIVKSKSPPAQAVLVSATMTKAVKHLATACLPELKRLEASGFHKPTAGASHDFRPVPPGGDKMQLLLEVLQADVAKQRKVLVFCNSVDSCRAVEHMCSDRDLPTVCYHGDMPIAARKEAMATFAGSSAEGVSAEAPSSIMVATDLAARGLDFPGSIDHVVNFDMPTNGIDYLHRAGRTARAGATGRVTSLLGPRRDRQLAKAIEYALDNDIPLDQVVAGTGAAGQQQQPQQQQQQQQRWQPPPREKRVKGPAPVKGQMQQVRWNPEHKFIHIHPQNGKPNVPFKELLEGKTGDERRRLLWEIAMDVKEWRRWRHAHAVKRAQKRREKTERKMQEQPAEKRHAGETSSPRYKPKYSSKSSDPEERWKAKVTKKKLRGSEGRGWEGRGRRK